MVDYMKVIADIKAKIAAQSTAPVGDPQAHPVESTSPGLDDTPADTPQPPDLDTWRRRIIEREQSTWTPERRQAQEDEIQSILEYQRRRGPRPSGPPVGIDRAEVFQLIGAVMDRLGKLWPSGLETDPQWQDAVNAAAQSGDRETFLSTVQKWEQSETRRVEEYMASIRDEVSSWPDLFRKRFITMVRAFQDGNRGMGFTVPALNPNAAAEQAFNDLRPFIPVETPPAPPAQADDFPFTDLHPATREILLRSWRGWDTTRRARFVEDVKSTMRRTGYSIGNAVAFVLQSAGPVIPSRPPALSPEEKQALHARMWPTPPSSPRQEPKTTVPSPDIAKLVSKWPKALRMKYAGLVGQYSNSMPLVKAMARAYSELKDTAQEDGK